MKYTLYIFAMLLPMVTLAQGLQVQEVPSSCAGRAFTMRVPVRVPAGAFVQYEWYRNDSLIDGSQGLLMAGDDKISYTIPDSLAHGTATLFFKYNVYVDEVDKVCEWETSRRYLVRFMEDCALGGTGSIVVDEVSPELDCEVSGGGRIVVEEIEVPDLDCHFGGGGRIVVEEIEVPDLDCHMGGAGRITVVEIEVVECALGGAGRIAIVEEEVVQGVDCRLGGAGRIVVVIDD